MNDARRQQYLGSMGISSWFPSVVLPHALNSTLTELDESNSADDCSSPILKTTHHSAIEISASNIEDTSLVSDNSTLMAKKTMPSLVSVFEKNALKDTNKTELTQALTPQFKLCMTFFSSGHLLVDTLGSEGLTSDVQRFYQAFGLAIKHDNQQLQQSLFKWPLFNNRNIDQGEAIARTSCLQHIQQTLTERPEIFVLLGDAAGCYASSEGAIVMKDAVIDIMNYPAKKIELAKKLKLIQ